MRIFFLMLSQFIATSSFGQKYPSGFVDYIGLNRGQALEKAQAFAEARGGEVILFKTDSTINLSFVKPQWNSESLVLLCFDSSNRCGSIVFFRCDGYGEGEYQKSFRGKARLVEIRPWVYLTNYQTGEVREILRKDNCFEYRVSKHGLSKKAYKALVDQAKSGG